MLGIHSKHKVCFVQEGVILSCKRLYEMSVFSSQTFLTEMSTHNNTAGKLLQIRRKIEHNN